MSDRCDITRSTRKISGREGQRTEGASEQHPPMTNLIEPYLAHLRAAGRSANTLTACQRWLAYLDKRLAPYGLANPPRGALEVVIGTEGWRPASRALYWCFTVGLYRWALLEERMTWDPSARLVRPKVPKGLPRPVSDDQLGQALARLDDPWQLVVLLAAGAGMRRGEICAARREHFTPYAVRIEGKGGKVRSVPLDPILWAAIEPRPPGFVVTCGGQPGRPFQPRYMSIALREQFDRVGLNGVTVHRFRHWFGTTAQRQYHDLQVTQQLLGHESPTTTVGYAALTDEHRRQAVAAVSAVLTDVLAGRGPAEL